MADTTQAAGSGHIITVELAAQVFEAWATEFRLVPHDFLTADEVARMEVADASTHRAIYFMALLSRAQNARADESIKKFVQGYAEQIKTEAAAKQLRLAALPKDACPECEGEGEFAGALHTTPCEACNGTGRVA